MFNKFKKVIAVMLAIATIFTSAITAKAATNEEIPDGYIISVPDVEESSVGSYSLNEERAAETYKKIGTKRYFGSVRYYDYDCYRASGLKYKMTGLNLTDVIYHKKKAGLKTLSYTKTQTYSSETAANFSVSVGAEAGVADMVKANVGVGSGITRTVKMQYSRTSTVMAEIRPNDKTGYYKMQVCYDYCKTKVVQKRTNGKVVATKEISMPVGESYAALLYSSDNQKWSR